MEAYERVSLKQYLTEKRNGYLQLVVAMRKLTVSEIEWPSLVKKRFKTNRKHPVNNRGDYLWTFVERG